MAVASDRAAGTHARETYRRHYRLWLRRIAWVLPLAGLWMFATIVGVGFLVDVDNLDRWLAAAAGSAGTLVLWLALDPPERIAKWQRGFEGERQTGKLLKRHLRDTPWRVTHDVESRWGNLDHVVFGPDGVLLLETKNLSGELWIENDRLHRRYPEDPENVFAEAAIARRAKGAAIELKDRLKPSVGPVFVRAVIVIWGDFAAGRLDGDRVVWIRGDRLGEVIDEQRRRSRPLDPEEIARRLDDGSLTRVPGSFAPPRG